MAKITGERASARAEQAEAKAARTWGLEEDSDHINVLYLGVDGTGKTIDALSMANLGRIIVVGAEPGVKVSALKARGINTDNIMLLPQGDEQLSHQYLDDLFWHCRAELLKDPDWIVGMVWDPADEISKRLLAEVVDAEYTRSQETNKPRTDPDFIEIGDYGKMGFQFVKLLRRYHDLPCHFVMTCKAMKDSDEDGTAWVPNTNPALRPEITGMPDIVCATMQDALADEDVFIGTLRKIGTQRGKDRLGPVTPRRLVDPTFERILGYARGDLTEETDLVMQDYEEGVQKAKAAGKPVGIKARRRAERAES